MQGMMRRTYTYTEGQGFDVWNLWATIGANVLAIAVLIFVWNVWYSYRQHKKNPVDPGPDPWDARSLEWMIPSPTPAYNYSETVVVESFDEFWHRKYGHDDEGHPVRIAATEDVAQKPGATGIHLPSPSYWPLVIACGFPLIGYGLIFNLWWALPGALVVIAGVYGWIMEPADDPDAGHGHHEEPDPEPAAAGELAGGDGAEGADEQVTEEAPVG
jgi:cytochrome c oxidase subunit 1